MSEHRTHRRRLSPSDFLVHIHPATIPAETLRFTLSFGLGGMAATLLCLLFISGLFQLLMYAPGIDTAYRSIQLMYADAPLSGWIRNIHFWSGNLLVIVCFLHLLRVFLTGALRGARRLNWIVGLVLFLLVLSANFSGYLLPWDQLAYWAVTIFTGMFGYIPLCGTWLMELIRGGREVGAPTLANFYAIHVGVLPFLFFLFCVWHFWLVRRAGGLIQQQNDRGQDIRVPAIPDLVSREAAAGLGLCGLLLLFAAGVDAPLADPANPAMSPNPAKAAWYFLGLQELLMHLHPVIVICVIPILSLVILAVIPFREALLLPAGIWFGGKVGRYLFAAGLAGGVVATFFLVYIDDWLIHVSSSQPSAADLWGRGVFPLLLFILVPAVLFQLLVRKYRLLPSAAALVLSGIVVGIVISLTIIGIWFRGPGMQLVTLFS